MPLILDHLNPNQRAAVLHGDGPLLLLAGAGSGKTSTIAYRIAHLVAVRNQPASSILGLSFTNKAAGELKDRVTGLISKVSGKNATKGLTISTFHSLCVKILRQKAEKLGYRTDFTIVDQSDQKDILRQIFKNIRIDERKFDLDVILFEIGQAKNRFLSREEAEAFFLESKRLSQDYAIAAASCYGKYQDQLRLLNSMDFDDLLYQAVRLLEEDQEARHHYNSRFRHIVVDEYQDTNPSQFRLLQLLTEKQKNLCVVGDDDQSIYAWRGADPTHILGFANHYAGARTITLDQNYRSTTTILDAANRLIANNRHRHPKKLWSDRGQGEPISEHILEEDRAEAEFVASEILARKRPWGDFAVLYRSNSQSRLFEEALRRYRIPYKIVGGSSFLDRKEVKDALCLWRLILNPSDDASLRRVLSWCGQGIGKTSIEALSDHAFKREQPLFEALADAATIAPRSAAGAARLRELVSSLRGELDSCPAEPEPIVAWARRTFERSGIKKAVEEDADDPVQAARKWENVEELLHSIGQIKAAELGDEQAPTGVTILREFLSRMTLEAKDENDRRDEKEKQDQVTLLTLHGAKGLEYPVVFLVGMEDGFLPHVRTIEGAGDLSEERRLCYVGITRARDHLILSRTKKRIRYGKPVPRYRSRFLEELPKELLIVRDESEGPDLSSAEARERHETQVKSYLAEIRAKILSGRGAPG